MPEKVMPDDVAPLRAAGVTDKAIHEALYVCFIFNVMDRLADAFDFHLPSAQATQNAGRMLYKLGYSLVSIPG